jgi:hypothetical protein
MEPLLVMGWILSFRQANLEELLMAIIISKNSKDEKN